jgi:bifunctional non-homologous end joining protein LigD
MTHAVPELAALPPGLVLDGELVAWHEGEPFFPHVCHRVLNRDLTIPLTFVVFDLLRIHREDMTNEPLSERRKALERLDLNGPGWATSETFEDGNGLFRAVCEQGLEGVVAKRRTSRYGSGRRGWIKTKNPNYWRLDLQREAMARSRDGRANAPRRLQPSGVASGSVSMSEGVDPDSLGR